VIGREEPWVVAECEVLPDEGGVVALLGSWGDEGVVGGSDVVLEGWTVSVGEPGVLPVGVVTRTAGEGVDRCTPPATDGWVLARELPPSSLPSSLPSSAVDAEAVDPEPVAVREFPAGSGVISTGDPSWQPSTRAQQHIRVAATTEGWVRTVLRLL